jgi:hypothetical protein
MRNKYIADAQEHPRWQNGDIADIEKHRAAFEFEVDEDPRIAEGPVHEFRAKYGPHPAENTICSLAVGTRLPRYAVEKAVTGLYHPFLRVPGVLLEVLSSEAPYMPHRA